MTRVMIMAGGTGGHVFPALAVAAELRARGADVFWLGTRRGLEAKLVPNAGIAMEWVSVAGLRGKGALTLLLAPFRLLRAALQVLAIILRQRPTVVLGMGGFVTGPRGVPINLPVPGGSLGARALNEMAPAAVATMSTRPSIWHQTGSRHLDEARAAYERAGVSARIAPFIDDMAEAYTWADLVLCRAGALTVAELAAAGVGAVLVPYPHAVDDHQSHNAQYLVQADAALVVQERELTAARLADLLAPLCDATARPRLTAMAQAARRLAHTDAAARVAEQCLEVARGSATSAARRQGPGVCLF